MAERHPAETRALVLALDGIAPERATRVRAIVERILRRESLVQDKLHALEHEVADLQRRIEHYQAELLNRKRDEAEAPQPRRLKPV